MTTICNGCGGVGGRDCFNPQECEWISRRQEQGSYYQEGYRQGYADAEKDHLAKGAQEWQPIETAPKDGTTVLLACGNRVTAGDWVSPEMHPTWEGDDFDAHWQSWDGGFHSDGEHAATHWMPLPAAPMLSHRGEVKGG